MLEWALSSGALCALLILLRYALRGKIGLRLQYALWGLALLRLLLPVSFGESRVSVQNILPETAVVFASGSVPASPAPAGEMRPGYTAAGEEASAPTPAAAAAPHPAAPLDTLRLLRLIWAAGAIPVGLWMLYVNLRFALGLRRSRRPLEADCPLPVYVSPAAEPPCLFGLFSPAVYLPPEAAEDPALGHILAHEYTHFRHGDQVWSLLRGLALALHWYDPLVWWAAILSRRDGELACDEGTLRRLGEGQRAEYGRTLIRMTAARKPALFRAATTMTGGRGSLRERIRLIAQKPKTAAVTLGAVVLMAALALGCTFTGAAKDREEGPTALPETLTGYSEYGSMTFRLDLDGWHEDFSYTVIWREGTAEPVLSPNRQLTRVGSSNRFILEYGVSLYLLDFDTGELRAFLPYEADGLRYADLEEQNKNQDNKARWASCPQVSPDGSLLLYQTDRAPGGIRAYDFATGLDRWLARGFATAGGVVWTERDSVILRNYDNREGYGLYEVSLGDGSPVRLCGLDSPAWDGAWPWVYGASENSFLALNLETGEIVAMALEGEVTRLRANPAHPALALLEWVSGENQYRLRLYDPGTREMQEVFRIADSASIREFRWTGENTLLLSEYAQGVTGTGSLVTRTVAVFLGDWMAECTARVDRTRLLSPAPEPGEALALNREDLTLSGPGDAYMLTAALSPELTGREIIWTSQDSRVATVSRNGLVTAVNHGTTTITASVGETTAECIVRVMGYAPAEPESYSTIMENLTIFTLPGEGLSPEEAAYQLAELFLEDLEGEDPGRTFRLTEYADLEVEVRPTLELDGETAAIYGLVSEERREDMWLVDIRARFRYTGVISPIGPSEGDRWCDQLHQGSPVGFRLRLNENGVYVMQSRLLPQA